jgi:hypothetical protein
VVPRRKNPQAAVQTEKKMKEAGHITYKNIKRPGSVYSDWETDSRNNVSAQCNYSESGPHSTQLENS